MSREKEHLYFMFKSHLIKAIHFFSASNHEMSAMRLMSFLHIQPNVNHIFTFNEKKSRFRRKLRLKI